MANHLLSCPPRVTAEKDRLVVSKRLSSFNIELAATGAHRRCRRRVGGAVGYRARRLVQSRRTSFSPAVTHRGRLVTLHPEIGSILLAEGTVRRWIALHTSQPGGWREGSIEFSEWVGGTRCERVVVKNVGCNGVVACEARLGCTDFNERTLRLSKLIPRDVDREAACDGDRSGSSRRDARRGMARIAASRATSVVSAGSQILRTERNTLRGCALQ